MMTRRQFGAASLAFGANARRLFGANHIDDVLRTGIAKRRIPCVAAMVANSERILYQGAFGKRDDSGVEVTIDSIFAIASMTKAITSASAMQLVEQGKVKLHEPVAKYLPQLEGVQVLDGYDANEKPILRSPKTPVTLAHLLTHTSGLVYANWSAELSRYFAKAGTPTPPPGIVAPVTPLMFDPGTRWQYGTGIDFAGKLVEAISGLTLEQYFQKNIFEPLGMKDTTFVFPAAKFDRLVSGYARQPNGELRQNPRTPPQPPREYNGGGGLTSTCADYVKFMQMILRHGTRSGSTSRGEILSGRSVDLMSTNQTGNVRAGILKTMNKGVSDDVDLHPGHSDRYTYGFLTNLDPVEGGRSAGSLAWAGIFNTFYWIDPTRNLCAVIMMQFLPFVDKEAVGLLSDFERAVYVS